MYLIPLNKLSFTVLSPISTTGSFTETLVEFTVVVVPVTDKLPVIFTLGMTTLPVPLGVILISPLLTVVIFTAFLPVNVNGPDNEFTVKGVPAIVAPDAPSCVIVTPLFAPNAKTELLEFKYTLLPTYTFFATPTPPATTTEPFPIDVL
ncbi:MAG: hypothetical protein EBR91_09575 [Flavobacteriia bacterium]|nr:hypothetical protein [Flavobacteriia bacterium]